MLYFAYGSNLDRRQFARRCPDSYAVCRATLYGYRLTFRGAGHADIIRKERSSVRGALYEVTKSDQKALDRYEGLPRYYHRITIFVRDYQGNIHKAFAYKMRNGFRTATPGEGYLAIIRHGYREWNIEPNPVVEQVPVGCRNGT